MKVLLLFTLFIASISIASSASCSINCAHENCSIDCSSNQAAFCGCTVHGMTYCSCGTGKANNNNTLCICKT